MIARYACVLLALLMLAACPGRASAATGPDEPVIRQLNDDYVKAFLACDVARFRALLVEDFSGVLADGRVIDKAEFLRQASEKPDAADLRLHDVSIRSYGDSAIVMALVTYRRHDGSAVRTRYSTLCVRQEGQWRIAWVQWTRVVAQ
jgi:ketosteroid isomerase-like protein